MSRVSAYLSFFKSNKVDYIYNSQNKLIEFPCIVCKQSAIMSGQTSKWECSYCLTKGNIITLIEFAKQNKFGKIYVPKKEQIRILSMLERLQKKYPKEQRLLILTERINALVNHYEKHNVR